MIKEMYNYQIPKRYKQFLLTIMLKDHFNKPKMAYSRDLPKLAVIDYHG